MSQLCGTSQRLGYREIDLRKGGVPSLSGQNAEFAPFWRALDFIAQTFSATFLNMESIPVPCFAETSDQIIWFSYAKAIER